MFLINVPVGLLALAACYVKLRDPDYLTAQRAELSKRPFRFDSIGLSLLVIVMVCWEVMLSKGQEWDWLGDPFWRVQTLAILFGAGLVGLIVWELRHPNPVVNFRPLRERNFAACCIIIFFAFAVLYGASTSLPGLLQSLFGYDALRRRTGHVAGRALCPPGDARRRPPARPGTDARWLIAAGLLVMAAGNYWMSQMNLDISPGQVVWPRVVLVLGLSMCFAPANVAAYLYTPLAAARSGRRPAEPAAQRRRQRRHVDGADAAGAPRSIPHPAARRISRSPQSGREFLRRAGAGAVPDRRSGSLAGAS